MDCDRCKLHTHYLERIICIKNEEITYLKSISNTYKQYVNVKEEKEINLSVYDIIDHNVDEINLEIFLHNIESNYPANNAVSDIIQSIIFHDEYHLLNKEKKNIIKYLNKDNQIVYANIEIFSTEICEYIFNKLKPIIENIFLVNVDDDDKILKENNRVKNIMLLKDNKFSLNTITKILNRLD